jgi:hypothetical protein
LFGVQDCLEDGHADQEGRQPVGYQGSPSTVARSYTSGSSLGSADHS